LAIDHKLSRRGLLLLGGAGALAACSSSAPSSRAPSSAAPGAADPGPLGNRAVAAAPGTVSTIATDLNVPWGIGFLPGGDALVTERETGRVLRVPANGGAPVVVATIPDVDTNGTSEGGLLGLAVSPSYARDNLVYVYLTSPRDNRIVRFQLQGAKAGTATVHPILTGLKRGTIHDGGRIGFGPDGKLYAGVGETGQRGLAQDKQSLNGKILRMNADGSVPSRNPFPGSLIWSYGHRNVQGFAWDSARRMWAIEFGQNRFDEVNLIEPGRNYGWPIVEGFGDTDGGRFTNPKVAWPTDEASPSGAAIVGKTLYIGGLQARAVLRVALNGTNASKLPALFADEYGRIRTVVAAPDGAIWFTTSNRDGRGDPRSGDDHILRLQL
jgi:glucose/arabinose dehydrogenase